MSITPQLVSADWVMTRLGIDRDSLDDLIDDEELTALETDRGDAFIIGEVLEYERRYLDEQREAWEEFQDGDDDDDAEDDDDPDLDVEVDDDDLDDEDEDESEVDDRPRRRRR